MLSNTHYFTLHSNSAKIVASEERTISLISPLWKKESSSRNNVFLTAWMNELCWPRTAVNGQFRRKTLKFWISISLLQRKQKLPTQWNIPTLIEFVTKVALYKASFSSISYYSVETVFNNVGKSVQLKKKGGKNPNPSKAIEESPEREIKIKRHVAEKVSEEDTRKWNWQLDISFVSHRRSLSRQFTGLFSYDFFAPSTHLHRRRLSLEHRRVVVGPINWKSGP